MIQEQKLALVVATICVVAGSVACQRSPQEREAIFLKRGRALLEQENYSRAILEFRNATDAMPKDAEPYYQISLAYLETRNYETAVAALRKALALNPKHAGAQLRLAALMTTSPDNKVLADAENRLQELLAVPQNNAEAVDALALTEWKLGRPDAAAKLLDEALMKFPADLVSSIVLARIKLSQNDPNGAEEVLKKWVANTPKSREAALALGRLYIQLDKTGPAESEFRRALRLDPKYAPALFSLALIQMKGNRSGEAEQTFKQLALQPDKDYQHLYGLFLFQQGRKEQALVELRRLAKADPDDRGARTRVLIAYVQMDKVSEADKLLAEALESNSKDNEALLQRSELRLRSGDFAAAEKDLNQMLRFQPDSAQAHFQLAKVKRMQNLGRVERQELTEALNRDQNFLPARLALARSFNLAKESKSALELMDQTPAAQKTNLDVGIERNWALLGVGSQKEAQEGIDRALRVVRAPELLVQDGFVRMKEKDYARAHEDADEALNQDPENTAAYRLLVESCAAQKQLPAAVRKIRELVAQRPNSALLRFQLGQVLVTAGNRPEGRQSFEAAAALDAKYSPPKLALAELDATEKRWDAARQQLNAVTASDPRNVLALKMAADIEVAVGNLPAAIAHYRSWLDVDGSNVLALNNLAYLIAMDNPDEALKLAQQAVELAPDDAAVRDTMGWVYYRKGIYRSAIEQLRMSVAKESTPQRQFHLAMAYLKVGDKDLGQQTLMTALKQDPDLTRTERGW
jgi:tetratricopeptide (TPR) repeat protein